MAGRYMTPGELRNVAQLIDLLDDNANDISIEAVVIDGQGDTLGQVERRDGEYVFYLREAS